MRFAEHKIKDTSPSYSPGGTAITNIGVFQQLTTIGQGSTDSSRVGDKCTGTSLEFRIEVSVPDILTMATVFPLRIIIFIWKDDTTPTLLELLQSTAIANITTTPLDHDSKVKRKLLLDELVAPWANSTSASAGYYNSVFNPYINKRWYFPLLKYGKDAIINFQAGTTAGINHIYMLLISPYNTANETWNVNVYARYNFVDL